MAAMQTMAAPVELEQTALQEVVVEEEDVGPMPVQRLEVGLSRLVLLSLG